MTRGFQGRGGGGVGGGGGGDPNETFYENSDVQVFSYVFSYSKMYFQKPY